jgi:hypothetical protein
VLFLRYPAIFHKKIKQNKYFYSFIIILWNYSQSIAILSKLTLLQENWIFGVKVGKNPPKYLNLYYFIILFNRNAFQLWKYLLFAMYLLITHGDKTPM